MTFDSVDVLVLRFSTCYNMFCCVSINLVVDTVQTRWQRIIEGKNFIVLHNLFCREYGRTAAVLYGLDGP